jgi:catechol 2,3-dioxygenase-like lactoylglutathione lyase family enzyme
MPVQSGAISHVVLYVYDFELMKDFYTNVLGFHLSDIGTGRGNDICFLTLDPTLDHHQLALSGGRKGPRDASSLNHVAFRLDSIAALRRRYEQLTASDAVTDVDPVSHGSWLSVYYRDPENNRMEFFCDTPWYVKQPIIDPLDFSLSDEEILRVTEETYRDHEGFQPMGEWREKTARELASEDA